MIVCGNRNGKMWKLEGSLCDSYGEKRKLEGSNSDSLW